MSVDIWAVMRSALDCLCDALADRPVCSCTLIGGLGPMPVDSCMCKDTGMCGIAWVKLDQVYPSSIFPSPDTATTGCTAPLAYTFHMGVARCQPGPDQVGNLPSVDELTAAAQDATLDMLAAYKAARCCLTQLPRRNTFVAPWQVAAAEDGGCSGGYWPCIVWGG